MEQLALRPFQQELVDKLKDQRSVLIGDEMGLGKTVEAIVLDQIRRKNCGARTLVIAPHTVLANGWTARLKEWAPNTPFYLIDPKNRGTLIQTAKMRGNGYFLVHWEALRLLDKDPQWSKIKWFHIIADECHRMKNRKAQQTRALKRLPCYYRTAMSGTPADNAPQDLWSTLNWLYPHKYTSYWKFYDAYLEYSTERSASGQGYRKISGVKDADVLLADLEPFYMRRTKSKVLTQLPPKQYSSIMVTLPPAQRRMYDQMKSDMISWVQRKKKEGRSLEEPLMAQAVVSQLMRLQQFAIATPVDFEEIHYKKVNPQTGLLEDKIRIKAILGDPSAKLDAMMELILDNPTEQFGVFTNGAQVTKLASERLSAQNIPHTMITGDQDAKQKAHAVELFQQGRAHIVIATIRAGGEGIELTPASNCIFLDQDWSPSRNMQAEDRFHRMGQKNSVNIYIIEARNTVDQMKRGQLIRKWSWIQEILGDK